MENIQFLLKFSKNIQDSPNTVNLKFLLIDSKTKYLVNLINMIDEFLLNFSKNLPAQIQETLNSY